MLLFSCLRESILECMWWCSLSAWDNSTLHGLHTWICRVIDGEKNTDNGEVLTARVKGVSDHQSLVSGLISRAQGEGKMDFHFPQRRSISKWGRGAPGSEPKSWKGWDEDSFVWSWLHPLFWNALQTHSLPLHCDTAPSVRRVFCFCLASARLLENLDSALLLSWASFTAGVSEPDTMSLQPKISAMLFPAAVAQLAVCLFSRTWETEESLLGFLWDDCCLLNNLVQPQKAQHSKGQQHLLSKTYGTVSTSCVNPLTARLSPLFTYCTEEEFHESASVCVCVKKLCRHHNKSAVKVLSGDLYFCLPKYIVLHIYTCSVTWNISLFPTVSKHSLKHFK